MIFAIDFDNTIATGEWGDLRFREDERTKKTSDVYLRQLYDAGHELILHSVRSPSPISWEASRGNFYEDPGAEIVSAEDSIKRFEEMRKFLRAHKMWTVEEGGIFALVWTLPGKPYADRYLDDRAEPMGSGDAWSRVARCYGLE